MRVAIGADHAGFEMKQDLKSHLRSLGHEVVDMGTDSTESVDYPDFATAVSMAILDGKAERGVVICGSGVGACMTANKIRGIRAGTCHDNYSARQGVEHDDMNVLVLGSRIIGQAVSRDLVEAFLGAKYSREERHQRRLDKVNALDAMRPEPRRS